MYVRLVKRCCCWFVVICRLCFSLSLKLIIPANLVVRSADLVFWWQLDPQADDWVERAPGRSWLPAIRNEHVQVRYGTVIVFLHTSSRVPDHINMASRARRDSNFWTLVHASRSSSRHWCGTLDSSKWNATGGITRWVPWKLTPTVSHRHFPVPKLLPLLSFRPAVHPCSSHPLGSLK